MNDFFISYNNADVQWAKWVAGILEEYGYTTIIQAWDFKPGNNFIIEMQNAILSCKKNNYYFIAIIFGIRILSGRMVINI